MTIDIAKYQKEITIAVADVVVFGGLATPLLLAVQQQWRVTADAVTVALGVVAIAKQLYAGLTAPATPPVSAMPAPSAGPTTTP